MLILQRRESFYYCKVLFVSEVDSLFTFVLQEYLILLTFLILKICFAVFVSLC